ncbi:hypothetical protein [Pseudonocardia sp. T1-2H]|uniref:hypothetical protein n=1 Tax=Pseudonocardia sp. T1-2H TaxID=3128899 RepID=UPI0031011329
MSWVLDLEGAPLRRAVMCRGTAHITCTGDGQPRSRCSTRPIARALLCADDVALR